MIICSEEKLIIGNRHSGTISDLQFNVINTTFIVERESSLEEMLQQLKDMGGYPFYPQDNYNYYKVLVD